LPELPDVPAIAERLPGHQALAWNAYFAPKGLPAVLVDRLVTNLALLRNDPVLEARHAGGQGIVRLDGPEPLAKRMVEDTAKWRALIERENIRAT
jgi:tripartite-type tricarboxylate transporter receptor subunit TctC